MHWGGEEWRQVIRRVHILKLVLGTVTRTRKPIQRSQNEHTVGRYFCRVVTFENEIYGYLFIYLFVYLFISHNILVASVGPIHEKQRLKCLRFRL